jgi:hypothetical protein
MAYNTLLIKRRVTGDAGAPSSLQHGELAFNEVDSTMYYGASGGNILSVAGDGAFVNRTSNQTIEGDKTFIGTTTLSSITFSSDSTIDYGGNVLTNLADPASDQDAATKAYVDTVASGASTATEDLSAEVYNTFVKLTDDRAVDLTGGLSVASGLDADTVTTTGDAEIGGSLTVTGDLTVLGSFSQLDTETTLTSAFSITNSGSTTALTVEQTGSTDIAEFKDDGATALIIKDGGNVGIGTDAPDERLTVSGNISASGTIYGAGGMEISGGGATTLYVEDGKIGVNTETPNEELTVIGSISASEDIFARNGDFTGTLDVDGATTLGSTLNVTGTTTLTDLTVSNTATVDSLTVTNAFDSDGGTIYSDGAGALTVESMTVNTSSSLDNGAITTDGSGSITGTAGTSELVDFIIDGGTF